MRGIALGFLGALALATQVSGQESPRPAQSLECSKQADARALHGAERRDFMAQCNGSAGQPAQSPAAQQSQKPPVTPAQSTNQPSFNCALEKSASARLICSDPELINADGALGKAFQGTVRSLEGTEKAAKIQEQVKWIRERNARCQLDGKLAVPTDELQPFKPCVLDAINARIGELVGTDGPKPVVESATRVLTIQECSTKYQAAKTADTLNGQKWNDFRVAQCGASPAGNTADKPLVSSAANDLCQTIDKNCLNRCNGDAECRASCGSRFEECKSARPDTVLNPSTQPIPSVQTGTNDAAAFSKLRQTLRVFVPATQYDYVNTVPGQFSRYPMLLLDVEASTVPDSVFLDDAQTLRMLDFLRADAIRVQRGGGQPIQRYIFARFTYGGYQESFAAYSDGERGPWNIYNKVIIDNIRTRMANEQAQRDRAAQEVRNADIMRSNMSSFTSKTGLQQWVNREDLRSNAIRFKGQIVGFFTYFIQLENETEGIFGINGPADALIVKGIDATRLNKGQQVLMTVKVNGLRPYSGAQVPDLTLVGIAYCQQRNCSEFGNIPN